MRSLRSIVSFIIGFSLLAAISVSAVYADFNIGDRIYRNSGCSSGQEADPVNLLFWNQADTFNTLNNFQAHVGWGNDTGVTMWLKHHGSNCSAHTAQRASGGLYTNRDHIRFFNVNDNDPVYGTWTAAAIHFDQLCNWVHEGRSFNIERHNMLFFFSQGGHATNESWQWVGGYWIWLPCAQQWEWVDGILGKIEINHFHA
ncbi:MAG: hypothetical protein C4294_19685 [Nitrospiraceae bacterium]